MAWLDQQWNRPSRSDHYLMQIALIVGRVFGSEKKSDLKDMQLKFRDPDEGLSRRPQTREQAARAARARWFPLLGLRNEE